MRKQYDDGITVNDLKHRENMRKGSERLLHELQQWHPEIIRQLTKNKGAN